MGEAEHVNHEGAAADEQQELCGTPRKLDVADDSPPYTRGVRADNPDLPCEVAMLLHSWGRVKRATHASTQHFPM